MTSFHEQNREKRIKLIENYHGVSRGIFRSIDISNATHLETEFEAYFLDVKYPQLDDDEALIESSIRYLILYLEEYVYDLKCKGLLILDHLIANITPSKLNTNMRSQLLYDSLVKYINDKESLTFLDKSIGTMCALLNVIESKYANNEHQFKKHSAILESLLNSCYMSSNNTVKCIYLNKLKLYIIQMDIFSVRHLEKYLTIALECVESNTEKISFDFEKQEVLLCTSLDLLDCIINVLHLRIYAHARRIISFFIKVIYFFSLLDEDIDEIEKLDSMKKTKRLIETLFNKNEKIKVNFFTEFSQLKESSNLSSKFIRLIANLNLSIII